MRTPVPDAASDTVSDAVVDAARSGDREAMRAIYEALAPAVLGYLRAKGVADPEAVTGDVFVALLGRLDRVTGGASGLRKLTFSIAHARMVDEHRRRARTPVAISYDADQDRRTVDSAEDEATASLAAARVRGVLALLPDDQREVLTLRVVADLSIEQVADVMGRSQGAVKQLQRRAMIAVRRIIAEREVTP
ncbi:MAG TPA: sigma-70 family RNA polymerase sigma factor [Jatrophihabitans sp.]|nr:sigma-70 family RNA polymerase sigma factor [Jatrophihabitans sp.]